MRERKHFLSRVHREQLVAFRYHGALTNARANKFTGRSRLRGGDISSIFTHSRFLRAARALSFIFHPASI